MSESDSFLSTDPSWRSDRSTYGRKPDGKSQHGRIVRELGLRIVRGDIAEGARLPPEADLLATYDVSRSVLREAIRVLAAKGMVASRQRAGAFVRARAEWHLLDPDVLYWLIQSRPQPDFVDTLMSVRRVFEPAAAAMAAVSATEADLRAIAAAYKGMEAARSPEELLDPDLAFHRRIASATHNDLLAYIGNMLTLALRESIKLSSMLPDTHRLSLPRHKAILTAIQNRDAQAAQQAAQLHLAQTSEDIAAVVAQRRQEPAEAGVAPHPAATAAP